MGNGVMAIGPQLPRPSSTLPGTATCAFSVFGTTTLDIVLADDGNEFYFNLTSMPSTTGKPVIQGVGKRQSSELSRDDRG